MHVRDVLLFTKDGETAPASLLQIIRFGGMHVRDVLVFTRNRATACHQVLQIIRFGGMQVCDVLLFTKSGADACHWAVLGWLGLLWASFPIDLLIKL